MGKNEGPVRLPSRAHRALCPPSRPHDRGKYIPAAAISTQFITFGRIMTEPKVIFWSLSCAWTC